MSEKVSCMTGGGFWKKGGNSGMKKILIVTTISGFLPQFELNDVKLLQGMGCEVHYASNFDNPVYSCNREKLRSMGIRLHHINVMKSPAKLFDNLRAIGEIKKIIDDEGITMVHCHNPMGGFTARIASYMSEKKPYVLYTAHGLHFYKGAPLKNWILYYPVEKILARITDGIVTINKEDYENAKRLSLRKNGTVSQIHGVGVDEIRFCNKTEYKDRLRKELGIPENAIHIVTAAELNDNKNQSVVIKAIAKLDNKNIYYSLCGKGPDKAGLQRLIKKLGLQDRVKLRGYRDDMENVLSTADIFAFPSKREGLGIAAVEALLCGVPLVVSDNRGTREYAQDGLNAIVCRENTPDDFADAIKKLTEDNNLRKRLSNECRISAIPFTLSEVEKSMRDIYRRILVR